MDDNREDVVERAELGCSLVLFCCDDRVFIAEGGCSMED